jgi:hypothetical protein
LFAPSEDIDVATEFGTVSVEAGAVVLIAAVKGTLAVYDLHDGGSNHVSITTAGGKVALAPGQHVLLTKSASANYERLNPFERISHRRMQENHVGTVRQYNSEFSIVSALNVLQSSSELPKRIVNQLLKNAAIIQTTKATSGGYQRFSM